METILDVSKPKFVKRRTRFYIYFVVAVVEKSGVSTILWKEEIQMEIYNFSRMHILAWVENKVYRIKWFITRFYGELMTYERKSSRSLLEALQPSNSSPWMVVEEFNEILLYYEKIDESNRNKKLMENFWEALKKCRFLDLGWWW